VKRILELSNAEIIGNGEVASVLDPQGMTVRQFDAGKHQRVLFPEPDPHAPRADPDRFLAPAHGPPGQRRMLISVDSFGPALDEFGGAALPIMPVMAPFLASVGIAFDPVSEPGGSITT